MLVRTWNKAGAGPRQLDSGISEGQLAAAGQGRRARHSFPDCKRVGPSSAETEGGTRIP